MACNAARMLEILMEPGAAKQKELVQEFAFRYPLSESIQKHAPMLDLWGDVLRSLTNIRRLHLTNVDIDLEKLVELTKLQHLKLDNCQLLNVFPINDTPDQARFHLQSLQLLDTYRHYSESKIPVLLDVLVSSTLTHLVVDVSGFKLIPWTSCTGLHELALTIVPGLSIEPEKVITALEPCISLKGLHIYGVNLPKEHAVRLRRLERLQMITCDVEIVEYLVSGRPVEHLRLHVTDGREKPPEWQGHNWKAIIKTIQESTLPIKTLDTVDFRRCHPPHTLEVLDQLVERFNALEELRLLMPNQEGVIDAIPFVARLELLRKICIEIEPAEELTLDPEDWLSWREARLRDLVGLSKSKHLREVDLGCEDVWRWLELKTWMYCGPNEDVPKRIELQ
ncbi:hypothetical protein M407DRAFT_23924 [Tulasnella calospora MUT 4182]|uniref:Uncharacterized protein n=1 Tax=Tulasnella calospora MUT 4182 TaxID=1051891 RepID=A0A0C3QIU8_9AGAM|nr:hypothetical protein M407DRAFT_23924 [Tulasnella calospora MUT 4182]